MSACQVFREEGKLVCCSAFQISWSIFKVGQLPLPHHSIAESRAPLPPTNSSPLRYFFGFSRPFFFLEKKKPWFSVPPENRRRTVEEQLLFFFFSTATAARRRPIPPFHPHCAKLSPSLPLDSFSSSLPYPFSLLLPFNLVAGTRRRRRRRRPTPSPWPLLDQRPLSKRIYARGRRDCLSRLSRGPGQGAVEAIRMLHCHNLEVGEGTGFSPGLDAACLRRCEPYVAFFPRKSKRESFLLDRPFLWLVGCVV